jgi:hypothetical protein
MDITTSATAAALRVGLNILVGRRRPEIEFYYHVHNEYRPPDEMPARTINVAKNFSFNVPSTTHRRHEIYVSFYAVNIGSSRAEAIVFSIENDFKKRGISGFGKVFGTPLKQMAPGQSSYLCRLEERDLYPHEPDPERSTDFVLKASYEAAHSLLNWLPRWWARFRRRSQYTTNFTFDPQNIATDLPPPTYNG